MRGARRVNGRGRPYFLLYCLRGRAQAQTTCRKGRGREREREGVAASDDLDDWPTVQNSSPLVDFLDYRSTRVKLSNTYVVTLSACGIDYPGMYSSYEGLAKLLEVNAHCTP